jgi:hypothetical protein
VVLDLRTALDAHLYEYPPVGGVQYKSSLVALLRDARGAAERDLETGQVLPGRQSTSWLGAAGYLILLDQIGSCFIEPGQQMTNEVPLVHAVRTFSHVKDEPTLKALYALRCALAHDYALFNDGSTRDGRVRPFLRHAFNFCADTTSPLVRLPAKTRSGAYDPERPPPEDEITVVNLRKVGDVAEEVVADLRRRHAAAALEIQLPLNEFHVRYGLMYRASW